MLLHRPPSVAVNLTHQTFKIRLMMNDCHGRGGKQDNDDNLDGFFQLGRPLLKAECVDVSR
jgi:hypothetical protein